MNHHFTSTALNLWKAENTGPGAKTGWFCTGAEKDTTRMGAVKSNE